jgi:nucleoside-diphosphate-sugar epimerase
LRDLIRKSLNHQPLEMVRGAGGAFLTMADLGGAMRSAVQKSASSGQVYNLGSIFLTWEEIGRMMVNSRIQLPPSSSSPPTNGKALLS